MKIYYDLDSITSIRNPVVTTGSFDGVHIGHKTILNRLREIASSIGGESVLITFHPHPRKVLFPDTAGKTLLLKVALLGIAQRKVPDLNEELAKRRQAYLNEENQALQSSRAG